jgi:hypothetical protein
MVSAIRAPPLELEILTLDPSEFTQGIREGLGQRMRALAQQTDSVDPFTLLRSGRERCGEDTGQRGQQEAAAVHYSMT